MLNILGEIFIAIGIFGELLALSLLAYSYRKDKHDWRSAAYDTGGRAVFIFMIGVLFLVFSH